ncbi:MAG: sugar phosphate isomerase/epimerase, partial [Planctomycetales bacterium]|nr:sugar phosphate isomerase/epimerase [Planctomycetales bacterium]
VGPPSQATLVRPGGPICAFIKFVQALPYDELADRIAEMGFDGIEATVRAGGHVLPERVEEDLPKLVEALRRRQLDVTVMASEVNNPEDPGERRVLETAAKLGIKRYRMKYFRYSGKRPVLEELEEFRPQAKRLAAANRELGLQAVYQNHAGPRYVGATLWDLQRLLRDISPAEIGVAFDIRHATAAGGDSWAVLWDVVRPHVQTIYVKDFHWHKAADAARQQMVNVPLGKGQVSPAFFAELAKPPIQTLPVSLHVEYLKESGVPENLEALRRDLAKLRSLLANSR